MLVDVEATDFDEDGFVVLRELFSHDEALRLRAHIDGLRAAEHPGDSRGRLFNRWEGVTADPGLWQVITHPVLLDAVHAVIGDDARYAHNSEVHADHAGYLWHRDCIDQIPGRGPDWDETRVPYGIVRACIALQTYAESDFAFGVVPGSHRRGVRTVDGIVFPAAQRVLRRLGVSWDARCRALPRLTMDESWIGRWRPAQPTWIRVGLGDCVLIHQRLLHSASPIHGPQYAIYLAYGRQDEHTRRLWHCHRHELPKRPFAPMPAELAQRLAQAGLLMEEELDAGRVDPGC